MNSADQQRPWLKRPGRAADKSRSNNKLKTDAEGGFVQKLDSGRHRWKGRAREKWRQQVGPGWGHRPDVMASFDRHRDRNAPDFA